MRVHCRVCVVDCWCAYVRMCWCVSVCAVLCVYDRGRACLHVCVHARDCACGSRGACVCVRVCPCVVAGVGLCVCGVAHCCVWCMCVVKLLRCPSQPGIAHTLCKFATLSKHTVTRHAHTACRVTIARLVCVVRGSVYRPAACRVAAPPIGAAHHVCVCVPLLWSLCATRVSPLCGPVHFP